MVSLAKRNGFLIDNPPRSPGGQGNGIESPRSPTMTVCSCCVTLKKGLRIRRSKFCFASYCRRRINTEGKAKAAGWGTYLNAAQLHNYYHLSPRLIWRKVVGRILGGWWFGVVWGGWSSISFKASIPPSSYFLFILFFKSSWCKIASVARNKNQFCLPSSSDDLCLLFCLYPSSMGKRKLIVFMQVPGLFYGWLSFNSTYSIRV